MKGTKGKHGKEGDNNTGKNISNELSYYVVIKFSYRLIWRVQ